MKDVFKKAIRESLSESLKREVGPYPATLDDVAKCVAEWVMILENQFNAEGLHHRVIDKLNDMRREKQPRN